MLSFLILRPDLESSHHFTHHRPPFNKLFAFLFFDPMHFQKFQIKFRPLKMLDNDFYVHPRIQHDQKHRKTLDVLSIPKLEFFAHHNEFFGPQGVLITP